MTHKTIGNVQVNAMRVQTDHCKEVANWVRPKVGSAIAMARGVIITNFGVVVNVGIGDWIVVMPVEGSILILTNAAFVALFVAV